MRMLKRYVKRWACRMARTARLFAQPRRWPKRRLFALPNAMAFVKLDCGILNSTLWVERDSRDIFITALLMAQPFEVKEPMEQLEVGEIKPTGFVVPPGWYGFVEAAGPGIVRRALADMKDGMEALRKLGEPDSESRSSEFDGRRLVRVNGGYIVLNYMKYRDKDATSAVRSARYRERKKMAELSRDSVAVTRDSSRGVTIAEAEAEAEAHIQASPVVKGKPSTQAECPHAEILKLWARHMPAARQPAEWTPARQTLLRSRWRESPKRQTLQWWDRFFAYVATSEFLTGKVHTPGRKPFEISLDWLLKSEYFLKTIEGGYHNEAEA